MLVVDCPWQPKDRLPGKSRGAVKNYATLSTKALMRFPLPPIADDAIMFFWRLASMQQDALDVVRAWDFAVKSEVVWRKFTKHGKQWFGMGRTNRASHEIALICTRGRSSRLIVDHGVRSTFSGKVPVDALGKYIHSAKPDEFFGVVERMVGKPTIGRPYLEMFARKRRHNWHAIGDQLPEVGNLSERCVTSSLP